MFYERFRVVPMKDRKNTVFSMISFIIAAAAFCGISFMLVMAVKNLAADYHALLQADLSDGIIASFGYDDGIYMAAGYGIEILAGQADKQDVLLSFLQSSLAKIDKWILFSLCIYTFAVSVFAAYYIFHKYVDDKLKHLTHLILFPFAVFLMFAAVIIAAHGIFRLPLYFPGMRCLFHLITALLSIAGGSCALALLLKAVPFKKTAALIAVPVFLLLMLVCGNMENRLFMDPYIESFDYVYETDSRINDENYDGEVYYDEERNVLVVGETEYPPQLEENPDYPRGISRILGYAEEVLYPYSGTWIPIVEEIAETRLPDMAPAAFIIKALIWILLFLMFGGMRKAEADA